jgi:hypothetical protein
VSLKKTTKPIRKDIFKDLEDQLVRLKNKQCDITSVTDEEPEFSGAT